MSEESRKITFRPVGHRDELPAVVLPPGERAVIVTDQNGDVTELPALEEGSDTLPVVVLPPDKVGKGRDDEINPKTTGTKKNNL